MEGRYFIYFTIEPKIKRIYKYHLTTAEPKITNKDIRRKRILRSLKKDE
jgi:hypothetical protein